MATIPNIPGMKMIPSILVVLLTAPLVVFGQGSIYTITLSAPGVVVEIADTKEHSDFRFGPGPGNTLNGMPNWKPNSWIVEDWNHPVGEPEKSLLQVKATFTIDRGSARGARPYVVFYVYDPATKQGFVYLPGRGEPFYNDNVSLLYRGNEYEGHWFHTTPEWTREAQAAIEKAGK